MEERRLEEGQERGDAEFAQDATAEAVQGMAPQKGRRSRGEEVSPEWAPTLGRRNTRAAKGSDPAALPGNTGVGSGGVLDPSAFVGLDAGGVGMLLYETVKGNPDLVDKALIGYLSGTHSQGGRQRDLLPFPVLLYPAEGFLQALGADKRDRASSWLDRRGAWEWLWLVIVGLNSHYGHGGGGAGVGPTWGKWGWPLRNYSGAGGGALLDLGEDQPLAGAR